MEYSIIIIFRICPQHARYSGEKNSSFHFFFFTYNTYFACVFVCLYVFVCLFFSRAALVAGGNRSAAFLMEWLGLPTLEASNNPDKPPAQQLQQEKHQQQQKPPQEAEVVREDSVVVENGSENPGGGVTNLLPLQGTATGPPPNGAEASTSAAVALEKAAAAESGSGFIGEIDGGEGVGGDSQLTVSCDPMDDGGGSDNGDNGCGNGNCNGSTGSSGGGGGVTGREGSQEGDQENHKGGRVLSMGVLEEMEGEEEDREEGIASTTKRKAAPLVLVEAPKRIRTSEGVGGARVEAPALEKDTGEDEVSAPFLLK